MNNTKKSSPSQMSCDATQWYIYFWQNFKKPYGSRNNLTNENDQAHLSKLTKKQLYNSEKEEQKNELKMRLELEKLKYKRANGEKKGEYYFNRFTGEFRNREKQIIGHFKPGKREWKLITTLFESSPMPITFDDLACLIDNNERREKGAEDFCYNLKYLISNVAPKVADLIEYCGTANEERGMMMKL